MLGSDSFRREGAFDARPEAGERMAAASSACRSLAGVEIAELRVDGGAAGYLESLELHRDTLVVRATASSAGITGGEALGVPTRLRERAAFPPYPRRVERSESLIGLSAPIPRTRYSPHPNRVSLVEGLRGVTRAVEERGPLAKRCQSARAPFTSARPRRRTSSWPICPQLLAVGDIFAPCFRLTSGDVPLAA